MQDQQKGAEGNRPALSSLSDILDDRQGLRDRVQSEVGALGEKLDHLAEEYLPVEIAYSSRNLLTAVGHTLYNMAEAAVDYVTVSPLMGIGALFYTALTVLDLSLGGYSLLLAGLNAGIAFTWGYRALGDLKTCDTIRYHLKCEGWDEPYVREMLGKHHKRIVGHAARKEGFSSEFRALF